MSEASGKPPTAAGPLPTAGGTPRDALEGGEVAPPPPFRVHYLWFAFVCF